jgi:CheY-like chemotaxis protein
MLSKYGKESVFYVVRILFFGNEPDNTSVLSMGLEDEGYRVDVFNDPMLAL